MHPTHVSIHTQAFIHHTHSCKNNKEKINSEPKGGLDGLADKGTHAQAWKSELHSWIPQGDSRELILKSWVFSDLHMCINAWRLQHRNIYAWVHIHTHTQTIIFIKRLKLRGRHENDFLCLWHGNSRAVCMKVSEQVNELVSPAYNHCLHVVNLQKKMSKIFLSQGSLKPSLIRIRIINFYSCTVFSTEILEAWSQNLHEEAMWEQLAGEVMHVPNLRFKPQCGFLPNC